MPHLPPSPAPLDADELQRYHRHLILPEVGTEGQRRLKGARVLLIGAGGLGSPAALYLAAAGVGQLGVVDADDVELSNLQRQVLHDSGAVGTPKVHSAAARLRALNPHVDVVAHQTRLSSSNALQLLADYDVIVDGSDNFPTRYLVNDACVLLGKPNVYGSVLRFEGQASVFSSGDGPCYRCLFREPPPAALVQNCEESGVLGVLPGLIGVVQATEAIKLITGAGETLGGRLLLVDGLRMRFRTIDLARDPECRACGTREITTLIDYDVFCGVAPDALARDDSPNDHDDEITPRALAERMSAGASPELLDVREPYEWLIARLPDARLVPLDALPDAVQSLDRAAELVVYCHHGIRSAVAVTWLRERGFLRARNLTGGIDRWSREVDPSTRRY
ncbi:MAG TPA: molybdopterin-synthase adenylyltransferase MoeB [Gemmatimonadaceae bacterium]|nr:molybdopterin-synthase adenylyltransferase MoeB [Gemmatimonadaceae bacterium]